MTHSRRGFLGLATGIIAGMTLDPERALWVPGAKHISVPALKPEAKMTAWSYKEAETGWLQIVPIAFELEISQALDSVRNGLPLRLGPGRIIRSEWTAARTSQWNLGLDPAQKG